MSDDLGAPLAAPEIAPASEAPAPEQIAPEAPEPKAVPETAKREPKSIADALKSAMTKVESQGERTRDEQGRFVAKTSDMPEPKDPAVKAEAPKVEASKATDAPSRFTPDAKAAWATTPEPVKAEVSRAFREMEQGLQQYQQRFEPLKPYFQMAEQYGTTVHDAMQRYTALEMALTQNPDAAINEIFRYAKVNPHEWAARITNTQPDQAAAQYQNTISALQNELLAMKQQMQQFNGHIQTQEEQRILSEVESFKASHPRFDELREEMVRLLETGYASDLNDAYTAADRLIPAPPQAQPTLQPQPPKRPVQISGAPSAGSNPAMRKPSSSISESLRRASAITGIRG